MLIDECPSRSWTIFGCVPAASIAVACACLNPLTSVCGSPAAFTFATNTRVSVSGRHGSPISFVKTHAPGVHADPARSRSSRILPLGEFPKHRKTRDGKSSWCKACHGEARRRTMAKPEKREEYRQKEVEAGRAKPPPRPMSCRQCGEVFQPSRNGNIYCS